MPRTPPVGFADRYRVVRELGTGGMATVYEAVDELSGRHVAVKAFHRGGDVDIRRMRGEVRLLAELDHPALVGLHDASGEDEAADGDAWLVMELVEGPDLGAVLEGGPLEYEVTAELGARIAGALAHLHDRGIVHRDVKPANVLLAGSSRDPVVKLADLGIARFMDDPRVTLEHTVIGTAAYLAPEQIETGDAGPASDVYALGLVLLECCTGTRAFPGPVRESALARLHRDPLLPDDLPEGWRDLVTAMTDREAEYRPSARAVADRLEELADDPWLEIDEGTGTAALALPRDDDSDERSDDDDAAAATGETRVLPTAATAVLDTAVHGSDPTEVFGIRHHGTAPTAATEVLRTAAPDPTRVLPLGMPSDAPTAVLGTTGTTAPPPPWSPPPRAATPPVRPGRRRGGPVARFLRRLLLWTTGLLVATIAILVAGALAIQALLGVVDGVVQDAQREIDRQLQEIERSLDSVFGPDGLLGEAPAAAAPVGGRSEGRLGTRSLG